jgi:hypothetical protein
MCILQAEGGVHFLVVYGGASPEHGPQADVVFAQLPDPQSIGMQDVCVCVCV